jgi:hypothetical protein
MEIKEAVEIADKFNDTIFTNTEEIVRAVETLLDLANQYLDIKEPEHKSVGSQECSYHTGFYNAGFNEALHLCKLAQMKKLEGITPEQLHEWYLEAITTLHPSDYNHLADVPYDDLKEGQKSIDKFIADKLRQHMGGKQCQ